MTPSLKVQAVEMASGTWEAFLGVLLCHQDGHLGSCVGGGCCPCCRVGFLPSDEGSSCLLSHATALKGQTLVTSLVLEGSHPKRKPCFQGEGQL